MHVTVSTVSAKTIARMQAQASTKVTATSPLVTKATHNALQGTQSPAVC